MREDATLEKDRMNWITLGALGLRSQILFFFLNSFLPP